MTKKFRPAGIAIMLMSLSAFSPLFGQTAEIDRLVAAVNGKVITEGDLRLARHLNTLMRHADPDQSVSPREELERTIDLTLMLQEMESFHLKSEETGKIEEQMQQVRQAYEGSGGLPLVLRRWGLQDSDLREYLRFQESMLRFVDFRFRPFVTVAAEEIKAYYRDRLLPELGKTGTAVPPLDQVSPKIEELLSEEKVNDAIERWTREARRGARVEYFTAEAP